MIRPAHLIVAAFSPADWRPYKIGAAVSVLVCVLAFFAPEHGMGGYAMFAGWAVISGIAASRRDTAFWLLVCLGPLALVAMTWPSTVAMIEDPWGDKWNTLMLFSGMCIVAIMTCILALIGPFAPLYACYRNGAQ